LRPRASIDAHPSARRGLPPDPELLSETTMARGLGGRTKSMGVFLPLLP
jgi:hypothetical protein